jgi:WD40-like Beta Propeller Repeat
MPNVAELLDRESQTVDIEHGDFERLLRRRERKQRNRRLRAIAVALVVTVMTAAILLRSFTTAPVPATPPEPLPPMTPGSLAYFVDGNLYVADWDGANPVAITDRPAYHRSEDCDGAEYWAEGPIWSPDGRYLAYRRTCQDAPSGWWDVMISDPLGNLVTSFPGEGWRVPWSPDSTSVAVWVRWGKTISVYGLDGVRQPAYRLPPGLMAPGDLDPVWSPDGTSLMVPHGVEIPLDGSTPRRLPPDDPRSHDATYSPDGSRAAYVENGSLVVADADGSDAREVAGRWAQDPIYSPAGDLIVFTWSNTTQWPYASEIHMLDVATGTVTSLIGANGSDRLSVLEFSPDGGRILFSRTENRGKGASSLWSIRTEGSDARLLVAGTGSGDWRSP